jgi:hypothetical protein
MLVGPLVGDTAARTYKVLGKHHKVLVMGNRGRKSNEAFETALE